MFRAPVFRFTLYIYLDGLLKSSYILKRGGHINCETNCIPHLRTSIEIADRLCDQNSIWLINFLHIAKEEYRHQYIHLFHYHLIPVYDTTVAYVERVHDEDENDGLKDGFASVLKHETY